MHRVDNWIHERSGWIVELIKSQCINISTYRQLLEISYTKLPTELRSLKEGLINIKNNEEKRHVRYINLVKIHPERITEIDKELANDLGYDGIKFHVDKRRFSTIETKSNICINVYCYGNELIFSTTHFRSKI